MFEIPLNFNHKNMHELMNKSEELLKASGKHRNHLYYVHSLLNYVAWIIEQKENGIKRDIALSKDRKHIEYLISEANSEVEFVFKKREFFNEFYTWNLSLSSIKRIKHKRDLLIN